VEIFMLRFKKFLSESVDKVEFKGHEFIPDRTVRVLKNPSAQQIEGLLNIADNKGYGAGSGSVRWFTNEDNLHVWHDTDTVHHDVHQALFGTSAKEYHRLEDKDTNFASGSFLRNDPEDHFHIGIRQHKGRAIINNHIAFKNLLHNEYEKRPIERFDS
jgi:hypothetical protein